MTYLSYWAAQFRKMTDLSYWALVDRSVILERFIRTFYVMLAVTVSVLFRYRFARHFDQTINDYIVLSNA